MGAIARLMEELGKLPGIGPKSAERITHYLLATETKDVLALADALRDLVQKVHPCRQCYNLTEGELCTICTDPKRDASLLCVVEQARDVTALERASAFRGVYHVLQGRLAPLDGVGPENLTIDALVHRLHQAGVKEVRMATKRT